MKKYFLYCFLFLSITAVSAQIQIPEGYVPGNRTMSASLEKNILFNATSRYTVTLTGKQGFDSNELSKLFDGNMDVNYTWGVPITSDDPMVIEIDNLPDIHTQVGAWIGFSTRYWPAKKFKIEGWDSWSANNWVTISDVDNNTNEQYIVKAPYCAITKLKFTFYDGCSTSSLPHGQMGLSEIYFIHPEATQAYDGLLLKCNALLGNIGIGTTSPEQQLTVDTKQANSNAGVPAKSGTIQNGIMRLQVNGNSRGEALDFGMNVLPSYAWIQATDKDNLEKNYDLSLNPNGGNVGIGTGVPGATLDVAGDARFQNTTSIEGSGDTGSPLHLINTSKTANGQAYRWSIFNMTDSYGNSLQFWNYDKLGTTYQKGGMWGNVLTLMDNGNVGIGADSKNINDKLTVNGTIHCKEVKVDLTGLADYVFDSSYKLMPLTQVEQYVNTNSHLPEMPSASEVSKNGLSMGEMQNKLLQKVEELTLYVIELKKTNDAQGKRIEQLEKNGNK